MLLHEHSQRYRAHSSDVVVYTHHRTTVCVALASHLRLQTSQTFVRAPDLLTAHMYGTVSGELRVWRPTARSDRSEQTQRQWVGTVTVLELLIMHGTATSLCIQWKATNASSRMLLVQECARSTHDMPWQLPRLRASLKNENRTCPTGIADALILCRRIDRMGSDTPPCV